MAKTKIFTPTVSGLKRELRKFASKERAEISIRFFKTGKGEYAEKDKFIGLTVPKLRELALKYKNLDLADLEKLLKSPIHEDRYAVLEILVARCEESNETGKNKIVKLYLRNTEYINNWDLVDTSAEYVIGRYSEKTGFGLLQKLAGSKNLWEKRMAIVSTFYFIKKNNFAPTLKITEFLMKDNHDLIHKACGWMIREVGKKNLAIEKKFLEKHIKKMPRTMLRYAIERFPEPERKRFLKIKNTSNKAGSFLKIRSSV